MGRSCRGESWGNRLEAGHTSAWHMCFVDCYRPKSARSSRVFELGVLLVALTRALPARAEPSCSETAPWSRLESTGKNFVRPVPLTLTAVAVLTPFSFATGIDQQLRIVAQRDSFGEPAGEPVSVWAPYAL